jgi:hypothetical protein
MREVPLNNKNVIFFGGNLGVAGNYGTWRLTKRIKIQNSSRVTNSLGLNLNNFLEQRWSTQIGLWAAFGKISKNIDILGQILTKIGKNTHNIENSPSFNQRLGRRNSFLGQMRAGHPCSRN